MNYKHCCVVDKDGYYKTFVLVHIKDGVETIDSYTLKSGECLIDAPAPAGMVRPRWTGEAWVETGTVEVTPEMIEQRRAAKLQEISATCERTIFAGIELAGKQYALTTNDQINIQNLALQVQSGAETVLYHADGELCGPYTAAEVMTLMTAAVQHVTYHTTYCNHMLVWARRASYEELEQIVYGAQLPEDLQEHMAALLGGGSDA